MQYIDVCIYKHTATKQAQQWGQPIKYIFGKATTATNSNNSMRRIRYTHLF